MTRRNGELVAVNWTDMRSLVDKHLRSAPGALNVVDQIYRFELVWRWKHKAVAASRIEAHGKRVGKIPTGKPA